MAGKKIVLYGYGADKDRGKIGNVNASKLVKSISDFCLPRECPACGLGHESGSFFCDGCESELNILQSAPRCRFCSMPVTLKDAPCAQCLGNGLPPFDQIVCLGVLKDALQSAVHHVKYHRRWPLAERLASRLLHRNDVQQMLEITEVLVPVPLHATRERERGFNQADVMARRIASGCKSLPVKSAGIRTKTTHTQATLPSRTQRFANLKDAFVLVDAAPLADKHIVLIDDVMTTGATLVSFARCVKAAKPASISAILLAVADPKGRSFEVI